MNLHTGMWAGETVLVVGGGPSASMANAARAGAGRVVSCNGHAEELGIESDLIIAIDLPLWRQGRWPVDRGVYMSRGELGPVPEGLTVLPTVGGLGWGDSLEALYHGGNTGFAALQLADVLLGGQGRIVTAGIDLYGAWAGVPEFPAWDVWRGYFREYCAPRADMLILGASRLQTAKTDRSC